MHPMKIALMDESLLQKYIRAFALSDLGSELTAPAEKEL